MNYLDVYYRILNDIKNSTDAVRDCEVELKTISDAFGTDEKILMTRTVCHIEEDWVAAIEGGLEFIEKAINEQRQFIRSNGEVVSIEKVKNVSRESVEHLARHSNFITREQEDENDLRPDQLYSVERLSDYAVYENKFLYMLLCYLRDFITIRYNKILELSNTYSGETSVSKIMTSPKRRIKYELNLKEERLGDEYLNDTNKSKDMIDRIDLCLKAVMVYLRTPLMEEISKVPMLKPPITKTNVLKMNNNFKGAVALYDFIMSYDKEGFSVEKTTKTISPFGEDLKREFSETIQLQTFLVYQYGLNIKGILRNAYEAEKKRLTKEAEEKYLEQLKALRKRVQESGEGAEEYMLMLEKRNRTLENDAAQLALSRQEIERLEKEIQSLDLDKENLNRDISALKDDIKENDRRHREEINELNAEHEENVKSLNAEHEEELARIEQEREDAILAKEREVERQISEMVSRVTMLENDIAKTRSECDAAISAEKDKSEKFIEERRSEYDEKTRVKDEEVSESKRRAEKAEEKYRALVEKTALNEGRLNALRYKLGYTSELEDHTSKEAFDELEKQYDAFKKLFAGEWKKTKKAIVKDVFGDMKKSLAEDKAKKELEKQEKAKSKKEKQESSAVSPSEKAVDNATEEIIPEGKENFSIDEEAAQEDTEK